MKTLLVLIALLFTVIAQAECLPPCPRSHFYTGIFGGANFLQNEASRHEVETHNKTGYIISGTVGYEWRYGLGLETEYAYRHNCFNKIRFFRKSYDVSGHLKSSSFMANLIWKMPLCSWKISPFVGGGIGFENQRIHGKSEGLAVSGRKNGFAWQVLAGLAYPIYYRTDFSVKYVFHKGPIKNLYSHSIGIGLTYTFG